MEVLRHILVAHVIASGVRLVLSHVLFQLRLGLVSRNIHDTPLHAFLKLEDGVGGRHPGDAELLLVNSLVTVHDPLAHVLHLFLVHAHDLVVTLLVGAFEGLKLLLKYDEVAGEFLVLSRQAFVLALVVLLQLIETVASHDELLILLARLDPQLVRHLLGGTRFVL